MARKSRIIETNQWYIRDCFPRKRKQKRSTNTGISIHLKAIFLESLVLLMIQYAWFVSKSFLNVIVQPVKVRLHA